MPIEEITESIFRAIWSVLKYFIVDIIIEIGIRYPGYLIIKYIWIPNWKKNIEVDSVSAFIVGVIFWVALIYLFIAFNTKGN